MGWFGISNVVAAAKALRDKVTPAIQKKSVLLTPETLKVAMLGISDANVSLYIEPLNEVLKEFSIDSPIRISHYIAQVGHESASFHYKEEIASGKAYDTGRLAKRLGNTPEADGDGQKYKGRGSIQITGRANYEALSEATGIDFIVYPELLADDPYYYIYCGGWFWNGRQLNVPADNDDILKITKRINGGFNGIEDRRKRLTISKRALGVR